jgi:hypothetical protein
LHLVRGYGLALRAVATSKTRTTTIRNREGSVDDADLHHHHHHPAQWTFLHRALELLIDLVSSDGGQSRQVLIPYLIGTHFLIRCRLAIGSSSSSSSRTSVSAAAAAAAIDVEPNRVLAQQLLGHLHRWVHQFPVALLLPMTRKRPWFNCIFVVLPSFNKCAGGITTTSSQKSFFPVSGRSVLEVVHMCRPRRIIVQWDPCVPWRDCLIKTYWNSCTRCDW